MSYSNVVLGTSGLQSYWKLDEGGFESGNFTGTVADSKGSVASTSIVGNIYKGGPFITPPQRLGVSLGAFLSGDVLSGGRILFGNVYAFGGTAEYTIEAWINLQGSTDRRLIAHYDESAGNGWHLAVSGGKLYSQRHWGSGGIDVTGATTLSSSAWYLVAVTWTASDGKLRLYVNGVLDGTSAAGTNSIASPTTLPLSFFDTSAGGHRLYFKVGSAWKYAALL